MFFQYIHFIALISTLNDHFFSLYFSQFLIHLSHFFHCFEFTLTTALKLHSKSTGAAFRHKVFSILLEKSCKRFRGIHFRVPRLRLGFHPYGSSKFILFFYYHLSRYKSPEAPMFTPDLGYYYRDKNRKRPFQRPERLNV